MPWVLDNWKWFSVIACVCAMASSLHAEPVARQSVNLTYDTDPAVQGCPNAVEFRSVVAHELGYDPHVAGSPVGLGVRVRPTESGIEAVIDWKLDTEANVGERRFLARRDECRALMTTVGFVVAVQIQLMASEHGTETSAARAATDAEPGSNPAVNPGRTADDSRTRSRVTLSSRSFRLRSPKESSTRAVWSAMFGVGPALGIGLGPSSTTGLGRVFGAVQRDSLALELGAESSLPSSSRQGYGAGFRHRLTLGTLGVCMWRGPLAACGLAKVGQIRVQGFGLDVPAYPNGVVAEAGPRVAYALGLAEHLALLGHIEALCSLTSWTVYVNHVPVWTMPRFAAVAGIDLALRFR